MDREDRTEVVSGVKFSWNKLAEVEINFRLESMTAKQKMMF